MDTGNRMVQGDAYCIPVTISNDGSPLDLSSVEKVEITLHNITKYYPDNMLYSDGNFLFPITQEETFALPRNPEMQIRVKFLEGDVVGSEPQRIDVERSLSKEIL